MPPVPSVRHWLEFRWSYPHLTQRIPGCYIPPHKPTPLHIRQVEQSPSAFFLCRSNHTIITTTAPSLTSPASAPLLALRCKRSMSKGFSLDASILFTYYNTWSSRKLLHRDINVCYLKFQSGLWQRPPFSVLFFYMQSTYSVHNRL